MAYTRSGSAANSALEEMSTHSSCHSANTHPPRRTRSCPFDLTPSGVVGSATMGFPSGWYAQRRGRMLGQLAGDLFMVVWIVLWWLAGRFTQRIVDAIATPARSSADAARRLADQVGQAAEQSGRIPGIGDELRKPFDAAVGSLQSVINAADEQVATIERAGLLLGWLVSLIPVVLLLVIWLPARIRFVLRARAAKPFLDAEADLDL